MHPDHSLSEPSDKAALVLQVGGNFAEALVVPRVLGLEVPDYVLGLVLQLGQGLQVVELRDGVLDLFLDEVEEGLCRPLAAVLLLGELAVADVLDGRVLGDVEPGAEARLRVAVDLADEDGLAGQLSVDLVRALVPQRRQHVGEPAPVRVEVDEHELVVGEHSVDIAAV